MSQDAFILDSRLSQNAWFVCDLALSQVYFKNESRFPWFLLVPKVLHLEEFFQLSPTERYQLTDEIIWVQHTLKKHFTVQKINTGALGNIVRQFHVHVIGRIEDDTLWPHSVWQQAYGAQPYDTEPKALIEALRQTLMAHQQAYASSSA